MTMRSDSRGLARRTSAPKRAMSYLLVNAVAISTEQQDRPKLNGQTEYFRLQAMTSWSLPRIRWRRTASAKLPPPGPGAVGAAAARWVSALMSDHRMGIIRAGVVAGGCAAASSPGLRRATSRRALRA